MKQKLEGMIAAAFTPMDKDGNVCLSAIDKYADWIARTTIKGVFVCGTTGEFSSLTLTERKDILEKWIAASKGRFLIFAHVGSNCQQDSAALAKHAQEKGADAIASISPSFFKPSTVKELVAFFKPVAAAAPELPFYYYHMPSMTGVTLPVDSFLLEAKEEIPTLAGIKFTHNNLMEMGACIQLNNGEFEILHGYDEILISGLAMGAQAGVGSTYNYLPDVYQNIFDAFKNKEIEKARENQMISIKMVEIIIKYGGGVRGGKAIMELLGYNCGSCRPPFAPFVEDEYTSLKGDLKNVGFLK